MPSKMENELYHFGRRLKERFNITPSSELCKQFTELVQNGETVFRCRKSRRITVHDVPIRNVWIRIVYDTQRKVPVTALFIPHHTRKDIASEGNTGRYSYHRGAMHTSIAEAGI